MDRLLLNKAGETFDLNTLQFGHVMFTTIDGDFIKLIIPPDRKVEHQDAHTPDLITPISIALIRPIQDGSVRDRNLKKLTKIPVRCNRILTIGGQVDLTSTTSHFGGVSLTLREIFIDKSMLRNVRPTLVLAT